MSAGFNNKRLRSLTSLFFILFIIVAGRLFYLQLYKSPELRAKAIVQRKKDIQLLAKRGTIYDRNGKTLAVSIKKQTFFATPYLVEDKKKTARKVGRILKKSKKQILKKLNSSKGFIYIQRKVDKERADKIIALNNDGISYFDEYQRYYPSGSIASQVLGFVGMDNSGLSGLEKEEDKLLSGELGRQVYQQDALGREIPGSTDLYNKPLPGKSIQLTIDTEIQYKAQEELKNAIKTFGAKAGNVVVMDPETGEILAMASVPDFVLNKFFKAKAYQMKNRSVVEIFEPGSTMKPFIAAAALEEKVFTPESKFVLPPTINVNGKEIGEAHDRPTVNYTLTEIIEHSSNVGMSKIALALKKERIVKYLKKFGYGTKTDIDFPGEISGVVPKLNQFYGPTVATVSFGQGVSVTSLQLARGYASFANGGYLVKPYIVKMKDGKNIKREKPIRIISRKTAWDINKMLEKVVDEGTGNEAKVAGYLVAGKTGTAQKAPYSSKKYMGIFAGYAPAENPKILVVVTIDEPTKAIYGGVVAAPAFSAITQYALSKMQISP